MRKDFQSRFLKILSVDVLVKGGGFLLLPVYLQLMTAEEFGRYSYLFSIAGMFAYVFGMGQHISLSRFFHTNEYTRKEVVGNIHLVLFTSVVVFLSILLTFKTQLISLMFKHEVLDTTYYIVISLAILLVLNQIFMVFLYQSEQISFVQKKNIFDFLCVNIVTILALYFIDYAADVVRITSMFVAYIVIIVFYYRLPGLASIFSTRLTTSIYKRFLINGTPVAVGSFANFFIAFGDRFVVEKLLDESKLGVFSFAIIITSIIMVVFNSFQNIWLPFLFKEKDLNISFKRIYKIIILFAAVSAVAGAIFYLLVYVLANNFIDKVYLSSLEFLWILVIAVFFQTAGMFIAGFYQIFEKNYISMPVNIGAAGINIALNYYLIAQYQLRGAAIATALISFMLFLIHFTLVHYYKNKGSYGEYFSGN